MNNPRFSAYSIQSSMDDTMREIVENATHFREVFRVLKDQCERRGISIYFEEVDGMYDVRIWRKHIDGDGTDTRLLEQHEYKSTFSIAFQFLVDSILNIKD